MHYDDYHKTHRMPRMLLVLTNNEQERNLYYAMSALPMGLDCSCLRFVCKGSSNMHYLTPLEYEGDPMQMFYDTWHRAVGEQRPYDIIISDDLDFGQKIIERAKSFEPKPAVLIFQVRTRILDMQQYWEKNVPIFTVNELMTPWEGGKALPRNTYLCVSAGSTHN